MQQILKKFREHEWYPLLDFLSPVFFEIVPTWDMARILTQLTTDSLKEAKSASFRPVLEQRLASWDLPIALDRSPPGTLGETPLSRGDVILRLYFAQILLEPSTCLDLRTRSFQELGSGLLWRPRYFVWNFSPFFLTSIRAVYRGFYEDEAQLFQDGLQHLQLWHAEEKFRRHFGSGRQEAQSFSLRDFRQTFHDIFVSCRDHSVRLPPEFLPFGLYLVTLYEHLEHLGGTYNVRAAYEWARSIAPKQVPRP